MRTIANLLTSLIVTFWVVAIAIISVQNVTPIAISFLNFQTVQLPFGLLLAFCTGIGIIGTALLQPLWGLGGSEGRKYPSDDDAEFFVDDEF